MAGTSAGARKVTHVTPVHDQPHSPETKEKIRQARVKNAAIARATWSAMSPEERQKIRPLTPFQVLRQDLEKRAQWKCERCGKSEEEELSSTGTRLGLHHLDYGRLIPSLEDVELLCRSCHKSFHNLVRGESEVRQRVQKSVAEVLVTLGVDLKDENFQETPRRLTDYLLDHFSLRDLEIEEEEAFEAATFPIGAGPQSMVLVKEIPVNGICPHHLLPIKYQVAIAYIPDQKAVGLSKLGRLAEIYGRQPLLQERFTTTLTDNLVALLETENVAVLVEGEHSCMTIRGVKANGSTTVTSAVRGDFLKEPEARAEFFSLVGRRAN